MGELIMEGGGGGLGDRMENISRFQISRGLHLCVHILRVLINVMEQVFN